MGILAQLNFGIIYVPIAEMHNYLDLLRNEAPVYARVHAESPYQHTLFTGKEPAGEGE